MQEEIKISALGKQNLASGKLGDLKAQKRSWDSYIIE